MARPLPCAKLLVGVMLVLAGCDSNAPASDATLCQGPELSSAFAAGAALSEQTSAAGRPRVSSEAEGACALAGLKQGLSGRRRDGGGGGGGRAGRDERRQCKSDGRFVGETAAALFCDLSIALGGLGEDDLLIPGPESTCSRAFESACQHAFDRSIVDYAASVGDPSADCTAFTQGAFKSAFEIARYNQCLFSIGSEPPPVDDCADGACECRDQASCKLDCQGEGCRVSCERTDACEASCEDGCDLACRDVSRCELAAGEDSQVSCERAHECVIASEGGDTSCRDVAHCEAVKRGPGTLRCERTGQCDLTCEGPDCDIICSRVGKCRARIDAGSVRCEHTGKCDVICSNGRRPHRTRDGRFVCEAQDSKDCKPRGRR